VSDVKRMFVAVNLPAEIKKGIHEKLVQAIPAGKARPVETENLHVTLKFLGYLHPEKLAEVREKLQALAAVKKFEVGLAGIGEFGGRVVWLGVSKGGEEMKALSDKLDELLQVKDDRFHAHVTLARNKELKAPEVRELLAALEKEGCSWSFKAESVDVMESVLSAKGPKYALQFRQPLE